MKLLIQLKPVWLISLLIASGLISANSDSATNSAITLSDNIESIVKPYVDNHVFNGSILVAKNGKVIFSEGFGLANKEWQVSNTADSKYGIGSITKSITAVLTMQLVEQKRLALTDTIDRYLPELPKKRAQGITVHHLLSHTSGLPNYFSIPGWTDGEFNKSISREEFSKILNGMELQSAPGERYQYSNIGFFFLGQIIEKVTGKDYGAVLEENILKPLSMKNTGLHLSEIVLDKEATGYQLNKKGGYRKNVINRNLFRASGDIYSTVGDLFKLDQALYSNKLLSTESKAIMFAENNSYGWNIGEATLDGPNIGTIVKRSINYSGQVLGFNSMMTRLVDDRHSIILIGNIGTSNYHREQMTRQLSQLLYGGSSLTATTIPLSFMLNKALVDGNLDQQLAIIEERLSKNKTPEAADERGIAALAQQIGWIGMRRKSIKLFELNARLFPESIASLANLAAAYQRNNRAKDALVLYEKAHKLAPDNEYVKQRLEQLTASNN